MEYLRDKLGRDAIVTAAQTPDGLADALGPGLFEDLQFVQPYEAKVPFDEVVRWLERPSDHDGRVWYCQLQNGSFDKEFAKLSDDVESRGPAWAASLANDCHVTPVCNMWLGNSYSVTSTHHDPFENVFLQVTGKKRFLLYPPEDIAFLRQDDWPSARYAQCDNGCGLEVRREDEPAHLANSQGEDVGDGSATVTWLNPPWPPHPQSSPVQITLNEGEMLYLPGLWWHTVKQVDCDDDTDGPPRCVSVNWWWDIDYEAPTWSQYKLCERLAMIASGRLAACDQDLKLDE